MYSMLITQLCIFAALVYFHSMGCASSLAGDCVVSIDPLTEFKAYPIEQKLGQRGHRARETWFTGRWCCIEIGEGVLGKGPPLFSSPFTVVDETTIAYVAVNVESGETKCININPKLRRGTTADLRVSSVDDICVIAPGNNSDFETDECWVAQLDLSNNRVACICLPIKTARQFVAMSWPKMPISDQVEIRDSAEKAAWFINDNPWFGHIKIEVERQENERYLFHGSGLGRVLECQVSQRGRFAFSELETGRNGRCLWMLTESVFQSDRAVIHCPIVDLYFPKVLFAPNDRIVMISSTANDTATLIEIVSGRLRLIKSFAQGYKIHGFVSSENKKYVGVHLVNFGVDESLTLVVDLETGKTQSFAEQNDDEYSLPMVGVTNVGAIVQCTGSKVFVTNPFEAPRLIRPSIFSE